MLALEDIAKLITSPEGIQENQLVELEKFSSNYPYTSLFSQLYLLGSKIHGKVNFDEELNKHAFRISDRSNLYFLIQDGRAIKVDEIPTISEEVIPTDVVQNLKQVELTTDSLTEEISNEEIVEVESPEIDNSIENDVPSEFGIAELDGLEFVQIEDLESQEEGSEEEVAEENIADEIETTEIEVKTDQSELENFEKDILEENLQLHLISSGYYLDELSQEEEVALEAHQAKKQETIQEKETKVESKDISEEREGESPSTFISWLHADKNYSSPAIENPSEAQARVDDFAAFNPVDQLSGDLERPKKEFFSPSKKAKESLNESTVPVSETLAKIFVLQGNYSKAIQVYEQLMLNYPEKKVFFANSIQQIKEKINNIA